jgi:hypothetical protein
MVERLAGTEDSESDAQVCDQENDISHSYADLQMVNSSPVDKMLAERDDSILTRFVLYIRQSSIESRDADFQTPKNGGVKRPSYHLDFGAHDPVVVFIGVKGEVCTLLGRHVAVRETAEVGADKVRRYDLCGEKQLLDESVSIRKL